MSKEHVIRISVFANRNPSLSKEQFHAHWIDKHGPLVSSWLQKHGFVQYTQVPNKSPHHPKLKKKSIPSYHATH